MASGKVFHDVLPVGSDQDTGATPVGKVRTSSVNLVNSGENTAVVKICISTATSFANNKRIEPDIQIPANGLYKLTGEIVGAGERIVLNSDAPSVIARVTYFEENE